MASELTLLLFVWAVTATIGWLVELLPEPNAGTTVAETSDVDPRPKYDPVPTPNNPHIGRESNDE